MDKEPKYELRLFLWRAVYENQILNVPDDLKQGLQIMAENSALSSQTKTEYVIDVVPCEEDKVYAKMEKGSGVIRYAKRSAFSAV